MAKDNSNQNKQPESKPSNIPAPGSKPSEVSVPSTTPLDEAALLAGVPASQLPPEAPAVLTEEDILAPAFAVTTGTGPVRESSLPPPPVVVENVTLAPPALPAELKAAMQDKPTELASKQLSPVAEPPLPNKLGGGSRKDMAARVMGMLPPSHPRSSALGRQDSMPKNNTNSTRPDTALTAKIPVVATGTAKVTAALIEKLRPFAPALAARLEGGKATPGEISNALAAIEATKNSPEAAMAVARAAASKAGTTSFQQKLMQSRLGPKALAAQARLAQVEVEALAQIAEPAVASKETLIAELFVVLDKLIALDPQDGAVNLAAFAMQELAIPQDPETSDSLFKDGLSLFLIAMTNRFDNRAFPAFLEDAALLIGEAMAQAESKPE